MLPPNSLKLSGIAMGAILAIASPIIAAPPRGFSAGPTPLFGSPGSYFPSQYTYPAAGTYGAQNFNPFGVVPLSTSPAYNVVQPHDWPAVGEAHLTVRVPANALVWVNGNPTRQSGTVRHFVTPPVLRAGLTYQYIIRAQWTEDGKTITREQPVAVRVTGKYDVDFLKP